MNGYIVDPRVFYWMSVADGLKTIGSVILVLGVGTFISLGIYAMLEGIYDEDDRKKARKWLSLGITLSIIGTLMLLFIPSKQTMIEMLIAKYATYENANLTIDGIKSVVDYIVESLK